MRAWRAGLKYGNGMESSGEMILPRLYSPFHTSSTYYTTHSKKNLLKVTEYYGVLDDVKLSKKSFTLIFLHYINQSF